MGGLAPYAKIVACLFLALLALGCLAGLRTSYRKTHKALAGVWAVLAVVFLYLFLMIFLSPIESFCRDWYS